jgi:hypothetical protein
MRRTAISIAAMTALAFMVLGCSSGDSGSGGSGGPVQLDASRTFKGNLTLTGTITLPPGSGAGKSIQLTASGGGADITQRGSYVALAGTTPGESVPYTITGLVAGEYSVRARVDQNGDGNLSTPGDLDGHSGGTLEAPIFDFSKAKEVMVGPSGATGVDFGVGRLP